MSSDPRTMSTVGRTMLDRRSFLAMSGAGLGSIALTHLLATQNALGKSASSIDKGPIRPDIDPATPHEPRPPHFTPRAKNIIVVFCSGAISQVDTFDYKPALEKYHGTPMPGADGLVTFQGKQGNLTRSPWQFKPRGETGKMTSDLLPNLGELADEMCFIHSLTGKTNTHGPGENLMSTGFVLDGFPSMGSWASYALGTDNQSLPAFVAISDPRGVPQSSGNNWGSGFLPAAFQGTPFNASSPIDNLERPQSVSAAADSDAQDLLKRLNDLHLQQFPGDTDLSARISSYELAARMQTSVPEVTDLSKESPATLEMYGANSKDKIKAGYARNCILARRLVERGVRFVQLFNGAYAMGEGVGNWDGHKTLEKQYKVHGRILDQPTAALLMDLKQRGMLDDTLLVFTTEFGRMPTFQAGASGRDHNPEGFTAWMAGAGVKRGYSYGATDEFGYKAQDKVCTVHDFHATILHLLGLDHERLSYYNNGIERRLTDVHGHVIKGVLA